MCLFYLSMTVCVVQVTVAISLVAFISALLTFNLVHYWKEVKSIYHFMINDSLCLMGSCQRLKQVNDNDFLTL